MKKFFITVGILGLIAGPIFDYLNHERQAERKKNLSLSYSQRDVNFSIFSGTLTNNREKNLKNPKIVCQYYGDSETVMFENSAIFYSIIQSKQSKEINVTMKDPRDLHFEQVRRRECMVR